VSPYVTSTMAPRSRWQHCGDGATRSNERTVSFTGAIVRDRWQSAGNRDCSRFWHWPPSSTLYKLLPRSALSWSANRKRGGKCGIWI